ncbi:helix-turn-helix domain-containing protein [Puniceibacterium confluentis]|uniref:helix-turn-helix domain-containing protein n=1 Tax=Puniceibacterium confluentis TaxID=1958944 RepID=UPI003567B157
MTKLRNGLSPTVVSGRIEMRTPDEVSAMLALKACGWGSKRIAAELGCSRNTVKRWLAEGGWCAAKAQRRPSAARGDNHASGRRISKRKGIDVVTAIRQPHQFNVAHD